MRTKIRSNYWLILTVFAFTFISCDVLEINDDDTNIESDRNLAVTEPIIDIVELSQFGLEEASDINDHGDIVGGNYYWNQSSQSLHHLNFTAKSLNNGGQVTGDTEGKGYFWEFGKGQQSINHPYNNYKIVEEWVVPHGINNHGEVVGESSIVDVMHDEEYDETIYIDTYEAFQWSSGATSYDMIEHDGRANDINDNGQIVGTHPMGAFKWDSNNYMVFLGSSDKVFEEAHAINNHGQIVGSVLKSTDQNISAFVNDILNAQRITESKGFYDTSHLISLLKEGDISAKSSNSNMNRFGSFSMHKMRNESLLKIWDAKQQQSSIQNALSTSYESEAFLWDEDDGNESLGTLGGTWSTAFDINDHGQVVGYSDIGNDEYRAFYWDRENGMIELPSDGKNSIARAINNEGQIVGENDGPVMWEITLPKSN